MNRIPAIPIIPTMDVNNGFYVFLADIVAEMFEDYAASVLNEYRKRQIDDQLSLNLKYPTAAKLKAESLEVCRLRFAGKDEKVLRAFFEQQANAGAYCLAIKKSEADLFKPLRNFLKGDTDKTQERNIELLAWLIDYEPRPYQMDRSYEAAVATSPASSVTYQTPLVNEAVAPPENPPFKNWRKTLLFCTLLSVIGAGAVYLLLQSGPAQRKETVILMQPRPLAAIGDNRVMYWADDHFETADAPRKSSGRLAYKVDKNDLAHFKKITTPDTLTHADIGKVWYYKVNADSVEYFTADGFHPVYRDRRLKLLTAYMLKKYVYHDGKRDDKTNK